MPVFISTTFAPLGSSVVETVNLLKDRGIKNIELGSIHRRDSDLFSSLKSSKCNFLTHSFFPPGEERFVINIASLSESKRRKSIDFIKNSIDFSIKINASIYTIHPGFLVEPEKESPSSDNYDFIFSDERVGNILDAHTEGFYIFKESLSELSSYIKNKPIKLAIETQGSVSKNNFMIFSRPADFKLFLEWEIDEKIGININLAHLNLASNVYGFNKTEAIGILKSRIFAVEVSHNDGWEDEHHALYKNAWYMDILKDRYFKNIPVIFEGRDIAIDEVINSYNLLENN